MNENWTIAEIMKNGEKIHGMWYLLSSGRDNDWMAYIVKAFDKWHLVMRFRYYRSNEVFDGKDKKRWYRASAPDGSDQSLQKLIICLDQVAAEMQSPPPWMERYIESDYVHLDCQPNSKELIDKLRAANKHWIHIKEVDSDSEN